MRSLKKEVLVDLTMLEHLHTGLGQVCFNFGKELANRKEDRIIFTFLVPSNCVGLFGDNVKYLVANRWLKKFPILNWKYDVWHSLFQNSKYKPSFFTRKVILTIHDLNFKYELDSLSSQKELRNLQGRVNRSSVVTCISHFVEGDITKSLNLGESPLKMIYNGVQDISNDNDIKPDFIKDRPFLFTLGEIVEKKNFHTLVSFMERLPEYDLFICGIKNRNYAVDIEEDIKNRNITNVFLPGIISHENKVWLYRNCDAFLFPSKFEGFGLPIIEAMQFGKPVFSSNLSSLPEVGKDYAFYWNNFDPSVMANLYNSKTNFFNENREYLALKMIAHAKSFTWSKNVDEYLELYNAILRIKELD